MRATKIILSLITAAALMASLSSCSLDPIANKDKSVYVVGDSITMSVTWGDNDAFVKQAPSGYSAKVDAFMGKQIADYQADVAKYSGQNVPERLVIQLGTNNANNGDGWTAQDTADYQKVVTTAPDRTCIVAIVPSAGSQATPEIKTNMGVAAQAIRGIMAKESKKVVLEFSDFQKAHPEFVTVDGIHLATQENPALKPAIVKAYTDWVWAGTKNCVGGPRK